MQQLGCWLKSGMSIHNLYWLIVHFWLEFKMLVMTCKGSNDFKDILVYVRTVSLYLCLPIRRTYRENLLWVLFLLEIWLAVLFRILGNFDSSFILTLPFLTASNHPMAFTISHSQHPFISKSHLHLLSIIMHTCSLNQQSAPHLIWHECGDGTPNLVVVHVGLAWSQ